VLIIYSKQLRNQFAFLCVSFWPYLCACAFYDNSGMKFRLIKSRIQNTGSRCSANRPFLFPFLLVGVAEFESPALCHINLIYFWQISPYPVIAF